LLEALIYFGRTLTKEGIFHIGERFGMKFRTGLGVFSLIAALPLGLPQNTTFAQLKPGDLVTTQNATKVKGTGQIRLSADRRGIIGHRVGAGIASS
jgi:hypothetical protein